MNRYTNAVRFPLVLAPIADNNTGVAAPIPIPIIIGTAVPKLIAPVTERACNIPTEAEALCKIAVITIPIIIPRRGLENAVSVSVNAGSVFNS